MPAIGASTTGEPIWCGPIARRAPSMAAGAGAVAVMRPFSQVPRACPHRAPPASSGGEVAALGQLEFRLGQLLDVDVLEGHDPHALDEPRRAVDVPDPGVGHRDLEVHLAAVAARCHLHRVRQVEPALGLDDVGEQADDVAVLAVQRQLHLGLVVLEVLGAHRAPCVIGPSSSTRYASGALARTSTTGTSPTSSRASLSSPPSRSPSRSPSGSASRSASKSPSRPYGGSR